MAELLVFRMMEWECWFSCTFLVHLAQNCRWLRRYNEWYQLLPQTVEGSVSIDPVVCVLLGLLVFAVHNLLCMRRWQQLDVIMLEAWHTPWEHDGMICSIVCDELNYPLDVIKWQCVSVDRSALLLLWYQAFGLVPLQQTCRWEVCHVLLTWITAQDSEGVERHAKGSHNTGSSHVCAFMNVSRRV